MTARVEPCRGPGFSQRHCCGYVQKESMMCGAFNIISVLEIHSYEMKTLRKTRNAPLKDNGYLVLCLMAYKTSLAPIAPECRGKITTRRWSRLLIGWQFIQVLVSAQKSCLQIMSSIWHWAVCVGREKLGNATSGKHICCCVHWQGRVRSESFLKPSD